MKILLIIFGIIVLLVVWSYIENHICLVHSYTIKDESVPKSFCGATFLYLVDLHNTTYGKYNDRIKKKILKQNPDYVLIGGDFLSRPDSDFSAAIDLLAFLCDHFPVYFVNGNHETRMKLHPKMYHQVYPDFYKMAKGLNCHFLSNERCYINRGTERIVIDGLELDERYFKKRSKEQLSKTDITRLIGKCNPKEYHILLAHSPNYMDAYADWGAHLVLSGHNHGGMARIPFVCGVLSTQAMLFPKYTKGIYEQDHTKMVVSAGMGSHTIKVRYFNPPEMLMVTLQGKEK